MDVGRALTGLRPGVIPGATEGDLYQECKVGQRKFCPSLPFPELLLIQFFLLMFNGTYAQRTYRRHGHLMWRAHATRIFTSLS